MCSIAANDGTLAAEYFPPVETHFVCSEHVAQTFKIQVMQPAQRRGDAKRFPVIYATDGNLTFDLFKALSYLLQFSCEASRFILVGIGYPGDSPWTGAVLRVRDLTFPGYPQLSTQPPTMEGVLTAEPGTRDFCGGEDFQRFIERELIPLIDGQYATVAGERTYVGHSAGGGFGLFTLFTRPDLFRNYLVSSPGLIFHGESSAGIRYDHYDFMLQRAREFIAAGKALPGVRLYLSVGTEEEFDSPQWQLTSGFYRMARLLKTAAIPGLTLLTETFPGETHMTSLPMAFMRGVRALLAE